VAPLGLFLISFFASLFSPVPGTIERAFLENDAGRLAELFAVQSPVLVSLPDPIAFSDQLSGVQAYYVFQRIFRARPTIEFFPETERPFAVQSAGVIFKARWSFVDKATQNQVGLQVFIFLKPEAPAGTGRFSWVIAEIKAERI